VAALDGCVQLLSSMPGLNTNERLIELLGFDGLPKALCL
jgi:hypothetical protein